MAKSSSEKNTGYPSSPTNNEARWFALKSMPIDIVANCEGVLTVGHDPNTLRPMKLGTWEEAVECDHIVLVCNHIPAVLAAFISDFVHNKIAKGTLHKCSLTLMFYNRNTDTYQAMTVFTPEKEDD